MKVREIIAEFQPKTLRDYGVLVLTAEDAYRMVRRAEEEKVRVLGIDAFTLSGGSIQPSMEHSIDYSVRSTVSESDWNEAATFIQKKALLGFHFEVVLGDEVLVRENA
jgi:hypothetical protein